MKISNILIALTFVFAVACNGKKANEEHGHSHDTESPAHPHEEASEDHGHSHDDGDHEHGLENNEQEEFTVGSDSTQVEEESTHTHDDGSTHQDH